MKFGRVALDDAEGAILAHSMAAGNMRWRKGRVLGPEDIAAMAAAGLGEVTAAVLEPGDIAENEAALKLARALARPNSGLRMTEAFTGRCNLLTDGPGVVTLDAGAIDAVNALHPMITVATVPQHQQMNTGGMVATVKMIAYAVPGDALDQACNAGLGALRLRAPVIRTARLIVSEVAGGAGEKGVKAIEQRLAALDVGLGKVVTVPHRQEAILEALLSANEGLSLILTGSATSDIDDVAPAALRAAGGRVERFGMPVDPGNLLFLGSLNDRPVIGLPGCARSPALNGADWVLSRVICGIDVSDKDISAMGVGGLLKEIPSRPQPRARKPRT